MDLMEKSETWFRQAVEILDSDLIKAIDLKPCQIHFDHVSENTNIDFLLAC